MNKFNKMGNKYNGGFKSIARFWVSSSTSDARLRRASEDDRSVQLRFVDFIFS
jgi:hypothetical protein